MTLTTSGRTWDEASAPAAVRLARRFEDAWRNAQADGRRPKPSDYLADDADCPGARLALLRAEMGLRWEAGEKVAALWYRERYPEMSEETFVALIYEEFCLREEEEGAEGPDPSVYLDLYPEVSSALRRVLDIHGLVGSGTTTALHAPGTPVVPFPAAGETIAGFRLVEELGRGAFARVFLARERQLADRPVALKVARTGSREPQTLARLQHTHIVPVHSSRTDQATGLHLLCMPYFGRVTLARLLDDPRVKQARSGAELVAALDRLGESEPAASGRAAGRSALARRSYAQAIAWWGARMAEALEHAHDRGVLHRDVKPTNVLVTADGMPMLLDFNLAREEVGGEGGEADRSAPGGTLDYMSPEHLEELGDGLTDRVDARSDVYSLGVLLYEALAGSRPFPPPRGAASVTEMLHRAAEHRRAGPPRLRAVRPDVPAALVAVVSRCLEPNPLDRYGTAAELAADLQAVADDGPLRHAAEPWPDRVYRWSRRHRRALVTSLPVVMALVGIATLVVQEQVDYNRNWAKVKQFFDEGVASLDAGDPARAMLQFESASRLADQPGRDTGTPSRAPAESWPSLEELRSKARYHGNAAEQTVKVRASADALFLAADPLRFRLVGFGGDLEAATKELARALAPFHVFEPDDWLARPDYTNHLDPPRQARLALEVNELLFLWAAALDRDGDSDPALRQKAIDVCDLALGFARPSGPWRALRAWISAKLSGEPAPRADAPGSAQGLSALACFQWGFLLYRQDRKGEAAAWFKRAVRLDEGNYWYHYDLAFAHDHPAGNAAEALRHYDAAVALKPRSPWVRFTRARYYRLGRDWNHALEDLLLAQADFAALPRTDQDPEFESQTRLELGLVRQSLGDLAGARAEYAAVVDAVPKSRYSFAARLNRAKLDADAGAVARARAEFDALLAAVPDDPSARVGRAMLALRVGEPAQAESDLSELLSTKQTAAGRSEALGLRAMALLSLGRTSEAAQDVDEAFRLRPGPSLERLRARTRIALGRVGGVTLSRPEEIAELPINGASLHADLLRLVGQFRRALNVGITPPGRALEARLTLAVALSALEDPSAELEADRAVELAPLSSRAYLVRARVRSREGRLSEALADVDHALDLEPDDPRSYELRGHLRRRTGDSSGGLADLDRAIALGDETASVRRDRADALMNLGDLRGALHDWSEASARDPDDPRAFLGRARTSIALGHWDQALADLEQAAGWAEGRPALGLQIALAYARCLPRRPQHLPRLTALLRRVWVDAQRPMSL